nr:olfactory receptor 14A16-like [Manis javanica]
MPLDEVTNHTGITEFLLLGFSEDPRMQTLHGCLFLMAYLAALLGNGLIIMLITWYPQLHTPMYFFLKNLSLIDVCYISDTVPKFVINSLMNRNTISFLGCVFQVFFFMCFGAAELAILMVMSYDRYVAICHSLHYETIMAKEACWRMVVASYISAGIYGAMHTAATFSTTFSSNKVHHFFCALAYLKPVSEVMSDLDIILSMFYTVVPPSLNPIIYNLRNKDIKCSQNATVMWSPGEQAHEPGILDIHLISDRAIPGFSNRTLML